MNQITKYDVIDRNLPNYSPTWKFASGLTTLLTTIGTVHSGYEGAKTGALVASIALGGMSTLRHLALTGNFSKGGLTTIAGIFIASALAGDTISIKVKEYGLQQLSFFTPPQTTTPPIINLVVNGPNSKSEQKGVFEITSQYENYTPDLFQERIASCHERFSTNNSMDWLEAFHIDGTEECYSIDGDSLIQLKNDCATNWGCYEENINKIINEYLQNGQTT